MVFSASTLRDSSYPLKDTCLSLSIVLLEENKKNQQNFEEEGLFCFCFFFSQNHACSQGCPCFPVKSPRASLRETRGCQGRPAARGPLTAIHRCPLAQRTTQPADRSCKNGDKEAQAPPLILDPVRESLRARNSGQSTQGPMLGQAQSVRGQRRKGPRSPLASGLSGDQEVPLAW